MEVIEVGPTFNFKMIRPALIHFKSVIVILGCPPKVKTN